MGLHTAYIGEYLHFRYLNMLVRVMRFSDTEKRLEQIELRKKHSGCLGYKEGYATQVYRDYDI